MRLYKTTFIDDAQEPSDRASWDGTLAQASATRKELKSLGMRVVDSSEVDVPTDKTNLMAFLNTWCVMQ